MDLSALIPSETPVKFPIKSPVPPYDTLANDQGVEMVLEVVSSTSSIVKKFERAVQDRKITEAQRSRAGGVLFNAESLEQEFIDRLTAHVVGCQGIQLGGHDITYSPENIKDLFVKLPWLREYVQAFVGDQANFFVKSSVS